MGKIRNHASLVVLIAHIALAPAAGHAQEAGADTSSMTQAELYRYTEDLRLGRGVEADPEQSLVLHQRLAQQGEGNSYVKIAEIYSSQGRLQEALNALQTGRDIGSDAARTQLAIWHVQERFGDASDPTFGVAELTDVVRFSSNSYAKFTLARAFERGTGTDLDLAKARQIYRELADDDHGPSIRRLGDFAREGTFGDPDIAAAAQYYRSAAETGYDYSWIVLARLYLDQGEYQQSIDAYQAAIAADVARAQVELAERHFLLDFGPLSDREYGASVIEDMAENGDVYAAARALSLWERRSRRIATLDLDGTLAFLNDQMEQGDPLATVALAKAYRNLGWRIPQARQKHRALVETFGDQLGSAYMREFMYDLYDQANHSQSRRDTYEAVSAQKDESFVEASTALRFTEITAFVYLLQNELNDLGYGAGSPSGQFDSASLRATLQFCTDQGIFDICKHGPLTVPASLAIIRQLAVERS